MKILARELEIPVIAVSQLSRAVESRNPPIPMLSDLRESGQVEQDSDVVMFVFRDEYYNRESERLGEADVIFAKHRNGPIGEVTLTFQPRYRASAACTASAGSNRRRRGRVRRMLKPVDTSPRVCPFGECDGSTWIVGEETNEARPCRCRDQQQRKAASGGIGTGIGRRFREVSFEREPIVSLDPVVLRRVRAFIRSLDDNLGVGARPVVRRPGRLRQDVARGTGGQGGEGRRALVRDLPRPDAARRDQAHLRPRLGRQLPRLLPAPVSVDVLVLDDLGAEKQTEWVLEQLYSMVNERWQDRRSIVVTDESARSGPGVRRARALAKRARPARRRERGRVDGVTSTSCACCSNGSSGSWARSRRVRSPATSIR